MSFVPSSVDGDATRSDGDSGYAPHFLTNSRDGDDIVMGNSESYYGSAPGAGHAGWPGSHPVRGIVNQARRTQYHTGRTTAPTMLFNRIASSPKPYETGPKLDFLSCLPYEVASQIIIHLDLRSLAAMSRVCKYWYSLFNDNSMWRRRMASCNWSVRLPRELGIVSNDDHRIDWRYFFRQKYQLERRWTLGQVTSHILMGHQDSVYCVQHDEHKLITGSRDCTIKVWDLATYQCIRTLQGHRGSVLCLQYKDHVMVSGSSDASVIVWDMRSMQVIRRLEGHTGRVSGVQFDERYIVSSSKDATIRIWDFKTGALLNVIQGHRGPVNSIQLYGNHIVSGSGDGLVKLWDVRTGACIHQYVGHAHGIACVRYDGSRIVSGSNDHTIKVWDAETGRCLATLEGHLGLVRTLDFDNDKIVSASYDKSIRVWDMRTGACLLNFQSGHSSWVYDVCFDKQRIVSTGQDGRTLIMDFAEGIDTRYLA